MDPTKIQVRLKLMDIIYAWRGLLLALLVTLFSPSLVADQEEERRRLEKIKRSIAELKKELQSTRGSREKLLESLEVSEKDIGKLSKKAKKIESELNKTRGNLKGLRKERQSLQQQRGDQQQQVSGYVNSAYRVGQQSGLRLLLNQKDPSTVSRNMKYFDFMAAARAEKISNFVATIQRLDKIEPEISQQAEQLKKQHSTLKRQKDDLRDAQATRKRTLDNLNTSLQDKSQALKQLESDQSRLQKLLKKVRQLVTNIDPVDPANEGQPFAKTKGKLPWPAKGKVVNNFGTSRVANKLRWEGILIQSPLGSPVRAVHRGRVVFSDYLRGHGLLIIVDHGGGYMSLYAHNQALYKEIGESVSAGETISAVGNSGGRREPGLYFELRKAGKPTNPRSWFRSA